MAYDKEQAKAVGVALHRLIIAVSDGVDTGDAPEALAFFSSVRDAMDEFSADKDATIFYALTGALEQEADRRLSQQGDQ